MTPLEIMKCSVAYASGYENIPAKEQQRAKKRCWDYNRSAPFMLSAQILSQINEDTILGELICLQIREN